MTSSPLVSAVDPDSLAPDQSNPAVREVMREEVVFCLPSTPIDAVAKLMVDNDLSEVVVLLDHRPVGFVCVEDILDRLVEGQVVLYGSDFAVRAPVTEIQARHIIRTPAMVVDEQQRVGEVVSGMAQRGRRLAVVMHEDESPIGMLTSLELTSFMLERSATASANA